MDPRVQLRAEVKLAQKKLDKMLGQKQVLENAIRTALQGGDRSRAEQLAARLNDARENCSLAELELKQAQHMERIGRRDLSNFKADMKRVQQLEVLGKANSQLAGALDLVSDQGEGRVANEMIQRLNEKAALNEARLDIAADDAGMKNLELEPQGQAMEAEDLLRQIELDMNIEPDY